MIKITTIDAWVGAFFIFMSIYLSAHIDETHNLIKYIANVKLGASRVSGGLGWRDYDRQFRGKKPVTLSPIGVVAKKDGVWRLNPSFFTSC